MIINIKLLTQSARKHHKRLNYNELHLKSNIYIKDEQTISVYLVFQTPNRYTQSSAVCCTYIHVDEQFIHFFFLCEFQC